MNIEDIVGKTFTKVEQDDAGITLTGPKSYRMVHQQDCCEHVYLDDVVGNLSDLVGSPITQATRTTHRGPDVGYPPPEDSDTSYTWTFFRLATVKGTVVLKWFGSSNGYYSEDADIIPTHQA